jgi:hypothetical protein
MGAFKMRGAANAILQLSEDQKKEGWLLIRQGILHKHFLLLQIVLELKHT